MKKALLSFILFLSISTGWASAQGISFDHIPFEEALEKAKAEDKLVFIDFYTVWCAPCKAMSMNVFTDSVVGKYFNKEFISIKLDAEKEGKEAARKFGVNAYPTLIFANGDGELIYKKTGGLSIEKTIQLGKDATNAFHSKYSRVKLKELYPQKQDDEQFLKIYISKMMEYGESPIEAIEKWLGIQTEMKEADVDMMEFLFKHSNYLLVGGKAERILEANYDEYWDIATRKEEQKLKEMQTTLVNNTKNVAYRQRNPELMRTFITRWKELPDGKGKYGTLVEYELDYCLINKDFETYKTKATLYLDSIMASKSLEEIRKEDKATYEDYKRTKYAPSMMGNATLERLALGRIALDQLGEIKKYGGYYVRFCDSKKEYKHLMKWIEYGSTLVPSDYSMDNLLAAVYKKQGKMDKAIEYKELALSKLAVNAKERPTLQNELDKMKQETL